MNQHTLTRRFTTAVLIFILAFTISGLYSIFHWPFGLSLFVFLTAATLGIKRLPQKLFALLVVSAFVMMLVLLVRVEPDNNRNWAIEHSVLPAITITNHNITIKGFRNFRWQNATQPANPEFKERTFDLNKLERLDLVVEPFKDSDILAHTMLRFRFEDGESLIVSVEARREEGETYSLIAGVFRQFELIYVFGSEEDLMNLRAIHRGTRLYAFPVRADRAFIINLLKDLADSANTLHTNPQFYRSIRDNCTTTLVKHIDRTYPLHIGLRRETVFPALTGWLLYKWDYMDTDLSYEEAREQFRVDEIIRKVQKK